MPQQTHLKHSDEMSAEDLYNIVQCKLFQITKLEKLGQHAF